MWSSRCCRSHIPSHCVPKCLLAQVQSCRKWGALCSRCPAPGSSHLPYGQGHSEHRDPGADQVSGATGLRSKVKKLLTSTALKCKDILPTKQKREGGWRREREREIIWQRTARVNQLGLLISSQMLIPCSLVTTQECTLNCTRALEGGKPAAAEM